MCAERTRPTRVYPPAASVKACSRNASSVGSSTQRASRPCRSQLRHVDRFLGRRYGPRPREFGQSRRQRRVRAGPADEAIRWPFRPVNPVDRRSPLRLRRELTRMRRSHTAARGGASTRGIGPGPLATPAPNVALPRQSGRTPSLSCGSSGTGGSECPPARWIPRRRFDSLADGSRRTAVVSRQSRRTASRIGAM